MESEADENGAPKDMSPHVLSDNLAERVGNTSSEVKDVVPPSPFHKLLSPAPSEPPSDDEGQKPRTTPISTAPGNRRTRTTRELFQLTLADHVRDFIRAAAETTRGERADILVHLFDAVAAQVEGPILEEMGVGFQQLYYYDLLADFFAHNPERVVALLPVCFHLWSNVHFPSIFALLFQRWIADVSLSESDAVKTFTVFMEGCNRLFWVDQERQELKFQNVYRSLRSELLMRQQLLALRETMVPTEMCRIAFRFYFYYESAPTFVTYIDLVSSVWMKDNVRLDGEEATVPAMRRFFVRETLQHVSAIKEPDARAPYLERFCCFSEVMGDMDATVLSRLYSYLHERITYSEDSRTVRHAAHTTLNVLYPRGRLLRAAINRLFRLLHPRHWPGSIMTWASTKTFGALRWGTSRGKAAAAAVLPVRAVTWLGWGASEPGADVTADELESPRPPPSRWTDIRPLWWWRGRTLTDSAPADGPAAGPRRTVDQLGTAARG